MVDNILAYGALDNSCCQSYERAHQEFIKDAWEHTNCKGADEQVMLRANRERYMVREAALRARDADADPEFAWDDLPHSWLHDEKSEQLLARQEREVNYYPVFEAATLRFRQHRECILQCGGFKTRYRCARAYITCASLDTPIDPYVRANPGLKYLNQGLVTFLINFYGDDLRVAQVLCSLTVQSCFLTVKEHLITAFLSVPAASTPYHGALRTVALFGNTAGRGGWYASSRVGCASP